MAGHMFHPTAWDYTNPTPLTVQQQHPFKHGIKRKNYVVPDIAPPPPAKHFVSEEEMTAEMRRLQIEEQAVQAGFAPPFPHFVQQQQQQPFMQMNPEQQSPFSFNNTMQQYAGFGDVSQLCKTSDALATFPFSPQEEFCESETNKETGEETTLPKLFVSEDVLKIQPQPILPPSLMNILSKNQLALVPWVPPLLPQLEELKKKEIVKVDEEMDVL